MILAGNHLWTLIALVWLLVWGATGWALWVIRVTRQNKLHKAAEQKNRRMTE